MADAGRSSGVTAVGDGSLQGNGHVIGSGGGGQPANLSNKFSAIVKEKLMSTLFGRGNLSSEEDILALSAMIGECMQNGVSKGLRSQEEETRKREEDRAIEKQRKREERQKVGTLSPADVEKKKRREERDAIRKEREESHKRELARKDLPLIRVDYAGTPHDSAYAGLKSTIHNILVSSFGRGTEWEKVDKDERIRAKEKVKAAFRNGAEIDNDFLFTKMRSSMSQMNYHDRSKVRKVVQAARLSAYMDLQRPQNLPQDVWDAFYDGEVQHRLHFELEDWREKVKAVKKRIEAGELPPDHNLSNLEQRIADLEKLQKEEIGKLDLKFIQTTERAKNCPKSTHKLGQGGLLRLRNEFLARYKRKLTRDEAKIAQEHGKKELFRRLDALLGSEDSEEESSSDDDLHGDEIVTRRRGGAPTFPAEGATTLTMPNARPARVPNASIGRLAQTCNGNNSNGARRQLNHAEPANQRDEIPVDEQQDLRETRRARRQAQDEQQHGLQRAGKRKRNCK